MIEFRKKSCDHLDMALRSQYASQPMPGLAGCGTGILPDAALDTPVDSLAAKISS